MPYLTCPSVIVRLHLSVSSGFTIILQPPPRCSASSFETSPLTNWRPLFAEISFHLILQPAWWRDGITEWRSAEKNHQSRRRNRGNYHELERRASRWWQPSNPLSVRLNLLDECDVLSTSPPSFSLQSVHSRIVYYNLVINLAWLTAHHYPLITGLLQFGLA